MTVKVLIGALVPWLGRVMLSLVCSCLLIGGHVLAQTRAPKEASETLTIDLAKMQKPCVGVESALMAASDRGRALPGCAATRVRRFIQAGGASQRNKPRFRVEKG